MDMRTRGTRFGAAAAGFLLTLTLTAAPMYGADASQSVRDGGLTKAPVVTAAEFSDVEGHWAEAAIERWADYDIVHGYKGTFRPDDTIVRSELESILDKLFGDQQFTEGEASVPVSREEAALVIGKAFTVDTETGSKTGFKDAAEISDTAKAYVYGMEAKGYISGYNGSFDPKGTLTRAEMISMLDNIVGQIDVIYSHDYTEQLSGGFTDTIDQYAKAENWTVDEFKKVCELPASSMSAIQLAGMNRIRDKQLKIDDKTLLQKVATTYDMNKYLSGEYKTPKGFVSICADVNQYKTLEDMFYGLRLDYTGTYFKPDDESYSVTRFCAENGSQAAIPKSPANGGTVEDPYPFGGAGFTTGTNGRFGSPEWTLPGFAQIAEGGAQLFEVYQDGSELLRGVYNEEAGRFLCITMNCPAQSQAVQ